MMKVLVIATQIFLDCDGERSTGRRERGQVATGTVRVVRFLRNPGTAGPFGLSRQYRIHFIIYAAEARGCHDRRDNP
jgi:hypothetical protein